MLESFSAWEAGPFDQFVVSPETKFLKKKRPYFFLSAGALFCGFVLYLLMGGASHGFVLCLSTRGVELRVFSLLKLW